MTWRTGIAVLIFLPIFSLSTAVLIAPSTFAQEEENVFTVSPPDITVRNAPPLGEPWSIATRIVVWNRDNVGRVVSISTEIPPEDMITPGYEPIPNENWVYPSGSSSFLIEENSYALVQISLNIPRWENLTGKKWEVWVGVERQAFPDEPIVYRPTVRMMIETTEELPPPSEGTNHLIFLVIGVAIAIVAVGVWIWSRRRGRGKPGKAVFSRSQG